MGFKNLLARFRLKKDTVAKWNSNNPVLMDGEPGVEVDGKKVKMKIGDGSTPWKALSYLTWDEAVIGADKGSTNYYGMVLPDSETVQWVRTPEMGIIPYTNDVSNGNGKIGTSTWPFEAMYAKEFHGNADSASTLSATLPVSKGGTGVTNFAADRVLIGNGSGNILNSYITAKRIAIGMGTNPAAGWRRLCKITAIANYSQFFLFITGGFNTGPPAYATLSINTMHTSARIKQLSGVSGTVVQVRLVNVSANTYWIDVYTNGVSATMGEQTFIFLGNVVLSEITTTNPAPVFTDTVTATASCSLRAIVDQPTISLIGDVSGAGTFTGSDININTSVSQAGTRWNAVTQGKTWSRIYKLDSSAITGSSGLISISCTRPSVICNATFLITVSQTPYDSRAVCTQLSNGTYTSFQYRIVANNNGSYYFEIYDFANNINSGTSQTWSCHFVPLLNATLTPYTVFTDGGTIPSGYTTLGMCLSNMKSGRSSYANGEGSIAQNFQYVIGMYNENVDGGKLGSMESTGTAFVVGNGYSAVGTADSYIRSNACRITYDGQVIGKKNYAATGADYAELREWFDGNPDNEDRRGYFVTLVDDKIKIAEPGDYVEGIISGNPAVLGNHDECWMGKNLRDEFGDFIYEDVEIMDEETGEISIGKHYKINPDYDPDQEYISRQQRKEWSAVGMLGHLSVRDDGSCRPNGYCHVGHGGIATASERGYRVVKRMSDNVVEIVFSIYAQF